MSTKAETQGKIFGYIIAPFIAAWIYVWENYVWIRWPINYWQWVALSLALVIACKMAKPLSWILGLIGAITVIAQVAKWLGLITLPLIHQ